MARSSSAWPGTRPAPIAPATAAGGASSGQQRFAPLNSWPDNGNLDKARRLLWPIKQKYGKHISWADLFVLTGNVAIESMGGPVFGFGGGRKDVFEPENDIYWGSEELWVDQGVETRIIPDEGKALETPLAAIQMGLIYVNPEGPGGNPHDAEGMARGHEGNLRPDGDERRGNRRAYPPAGMPSASATAPALPDTLSGAPGKRRDAPDGLWLGQPMPNRSTRGTSPPRASKARGRPTRPQWGNDYFRLLFKYEYELVESPAGAKQWQPIDQEEADMAPDARDPSKKVPTP